jgi:hypothetical protein
MLAFFGRRATYSALVERREEGYSNSDRESPL